MRALLIIVTLACCLPFYGGAQQKAINIDFKLPYLRSDDSIQVYLTRYDVDLRPLSKSWVVKAGNGKFHIAIPTDLPFQYVSFSYPGDSLHKYIRSSGGYLCEGGEAIEISGKNGELHFTGKGAALMNLQEELKDLNRAYSKKFNYDYRGSVHFFDPAAIRSNFLWVDSVTREGIALLRSHREQVTTRAFDVLYVQQLAINQGTKWTHFPGSYDPRNDSLHRALIGYDDAVGVELVSPAIQKNSDLIYASGYFEAILSKYKIELFNNDYKKFAAQPVYDRIKANFSGVLREKLLTCLIYQERNSANDTSGMIDEVMAQATIPELKALLTELRAGLKGAAAYNFALQDTTGKVWHLTDFKGKVVVIDFWYNGCGACRILYPSLKKIEEKYRHNANVVFMTMILPSTRQVWLDGINGGGYTSPDVLNLWLDLKDGLDNAHPVMHNYHIGGFPTLVMIDPNGRMMVSPERPDFDGGVDMEAKIKAGMGSM